MIPSAFFVVNDRIVLYKEATHGYPRKKSMNSSLRFVQVPLGPSSSITNTNGALRPFASTTIATPFGPHVCFAVNSRTLGSARLIASRTNSSVNKSATAHLHVRIPNCIGHRFGFPDYFRIANYTIGGLFSQLLPSIF